MWSTTAVVQEVLMEAVKSLKQSVFENTGILEIQLKWILRSKLDLEI